MDEMLIKGIARDDNVARISIIGVPDEPGVAFKIFSFLSQKRINIDIILQSIGRDGTKDITFTVARSNLETAIEVLNENLSVFNGRKITSDDNISKVSIVGAGMESNPGVAAKMFEALYESGINIQMISTSEIKISVLIKKSDSEHAVKAIHDYFHLGA